MTDSQAQPRWSEKREHWNMLTSGSGRRRRRIGPTTLPTLKPTRSHSEGGGTSETNDTSATNETGGYSTRPLMEETMRLTLSSPKQAQESTFHTQSSSILSSMD